MQDRVFSTKDLASSSKKKLGGAHALVFKSPDGTGAATAKASPSLRLPPVGRSLSFFNQPVSMTELKDILRRCDEIIDNWMAKEDVLKLLLYASQNEKLPTKRACLLYLSKQADPSLLNSEAFNRLPAALQAEVKACLIKKESDEKSAASASSSASNPAHLSSAAATAATASSLNEAGHSSLVKSSEELLSSKRRHNS